MKKLELSAMSEKKKWFVINGGDLDYSIRFCAECDFPGTPFETFGEAKKFAMVCIRNDIQEMRLHLYEFKKMTRKQVIKESENE